MFGKDRATLIALKVTDLNENATHCPDAAGWIALRSRHIYRDQNWATATPARGLRLATQSGGDFVWVEGYWYPVGNHYRWHDGYWTRPPYAGAHWVGPHHDGERFF